MSFIADFHIHSKYSRATSKDMDLETLDKWARIKGVDILGTGDFTHPAWLKELKSKLEPVEPGLFKLRKVNKIKLNNGWHLPNDNAESFGVRFLLTSEISCIYKKRGKTRKVHVLVFAPSFAAVEKINAHLGWIGNLKADGRPILGLDAKELAKIVLNISPEAMIVPAHIWTPHFSVFGSESGFNSLKDCFDEYARHIYALETGLSSDPAMNWRLSDLDNISLISNSDSHSPHRIGREANIFEGKIEGYKPIMEALRLGVKAPSSVKNRLAKTIEFFPEEGKYHYDGHRNCKISFSPEETKKHKGICPVCKKKLTIGVLSRVYSLADRPIGGQPARVVPFTCLIPLEEIIADNFGVGTGTKKVDTTYQELINRFGNEFKILTELPKEELLRAAKPEVAEAIMRVREGKVKIHPGYDGEYGKVEIYNEEERKHLNKQKTLF
ncbi:MAG: endonuclease Q family protein [Candidatus Portnoybacteria bacterium]|nr:endonuclease Q family protein [Candidatus Portnoybacteria bacterium]MDD4982669.1 endonuclease Q family protein [Candidatus Portnoybacteria bacterium]